MAARMRCPQCQASMNKDADECPECGWDNVLVQRAQDAKTKRSAADRHEQRLEEKYSGTKKP